MTTVTPVSDGRATHTTLVVDQNAQATFVTLDDSINKILPSQLQKQLLLSVTNNQGWSFTQGLLLGQLSVLLVIAAFIKFFIFSDSKATDSIKKSNLMKSELNNNNNSAGANANAASNNSNSNKISAKAGNSNDLSSENKDVLINSILEKTYYNVETHSPETLDWFNVLVAQTINQFRQEALNSDNIINSLNEFLVKSELPDYLDKIKITELDIGDDFPIFSNCRIMKNKLNNNLQAKIDVDLSDTLTLGIETNLLLNTPKPLFASLPIQLSVSIVRFSACLTVSLISIGEGNNEILNDDQGHGTALMFSFSPDFRLNFNIKSLIGARSKLENIPKIGNLIENQLKRWFVERCVEPRYQIVRMPSLWPRKKNVREPVNSENDLDVDDVMSK